MNRKHICDRCWKPCMNASIWQCGVTTCLAFYANESENMFRLFLVAIEVMQKNKKMEISIF